MKEDVIAANLANLRQSVNELKENVDKLNDNSSQQVQSVVSPIEERTVYNSVAKSFCNCWNDALSILKKSVRKSLYGKNSRTKSLSPSGCPNL